MSSKKKATPKPAKSASRKANKDAQASAELKQLEDAQQLIKRKNQERVDKANEAISAICKQFGVTLKSTIQVVDIKKQ